MTSKITDKLGEDLYEKTRAELNTFLEETNALLAAGDALHEDRTAQAQDRLAAFLRGAANSVLDDAQQASARESFFKAKAYVQTHPWQAVGLAAGIGLIASLVLKRRQG
jgi:ElaB/YqjD/DUF883 family membrane-anchored ribosome-binding protein